MTEVVFVRAMARSFYNHEAAVLLPGAGLGFSRPWDREEQMQKLAAALSCGFSLLMGFSFILVGSVGLSRPFVREFMGKWSGFAVISLGLLLMFLGIIHGWVVFIHSKKDGLPMNILLFFSAAVVIVCGAAVISEGSTVISSLRNDCLANSRASYVQQMYNNLYEFKTNCGYENITDCDGYVPKFGLKETVHFIQLMESQGDCSGMCWTKGRIFLPGNDPFSDPFADYDDDDFFMLSMDSTEGDNQPDKEPRTPDNTPCVRTVLANFDSDDVGYSYLALGTGLITAILLQCILVRAPSASSSSSSEPPADSPGDSGQPGQDSSSIDIPYALVQDRPRGETQIIA
eukprot:GILJ01010468.1.p1 GENE.GILJ01010468.1~~GILJ01010468.1.p1  ORF type:complete len:344 (+),score=41.33 GILJ01010468.1:229-1260(+)